MSFADPELQREALFARSDGSAAGQQRAREAAGERMTPAEAERALARQHEAMQQALRTASQSLATGVETLTAVDRQGETLARSERTIDETQHLADRSHRVLRGMTWTGAVKNFFTKELPENAPAAAPVPSLAARRRLEERGEAAQGFICPQCYEEMRSPAELARHFQRAHGLAESGGGDFSAAAADPDRPPAAPARRSEAAERAALMGGARPPAPPQGQDFDQGGAQRQMQATDALIDELSPQVQDMLAVSQTLGEALQENNAALARVGDKTEALDDSLRSATRKADRLISGASRTRNRFVGLVALREVRSRLLLVVEGEDVSLAATAMHPHCVFEHHMRLSNTSGFRNRFTGKWLGLDMFGRLRVRGARFKRWEEFEVRLDSRESTELFCCARSFGSGGYVAVDGDQRLFCIGASLQDKARASKWELVVVERDPYPGRSLSAGQSSEDGAGRDGAGREGAARDGAGRRPAGWD